MKKTFLIFFIFIAALIYSETTTNIEDYNLFYKGKKLLDENKYEEAQLVFETLKASYPDSLLFRTTFANYYIGLSYYKSQNFQKAISFLINSTYEKKYEIKYLLGMCYKSSDSELSKKFFLELYSDTYDSKAFEYEKLALIELSAFDKKYVGIYDVKFKKDFSKLNTLPDEDIKKIADYFFSFGDFDSSLALYTKLNSIQRSDKMEINILKSLFSKKDYSKIIETAPEFLSKNTLKDDIFYYLGNSFRRTGKYNQAIDTFSKIESFSMKSEIDFVIGILYYVQGKYEESIPYFLKTKDPKGIEYLVNTYEKTGNTYERSQTLYKIFSQNPYSEISAYYRYILYLETKDTKYLEELLEYNYNSYYYELASNILKKDKQLLEFDFDFFNKKYSVLLEKINKLTELGYFEAVKLEIDNNSFDFEDAVYKNYLIVTSFEKLGKYNEAVLQSFRYNFSFSKYSNLVKYLYPLYYNSEIEKYSALYGVDKYLIYSIMKQESLFKNDIISSASAYGLMQLIVPTATKFDSSATADKLLIPDFNINLGTQYLKSLSNKYKNNLNPIIASYNAGETNVDKWISRYSEVNTDNIPFAETKEYLKKVLNNYYKYKKLYR